MEENHAETINIFTIITINKILEEFEKNTEKNRRIDFFENILNNA